MFKTPFKPVGYYVFNYKPRYYDEQKERLEALEDKYRKKSDNSEDDYELTLSKNNLKNEWMRNKSSSINDSNYTYRLLLVIVVLCLITWGLFNFDKIISAKQGFAKVIEALWSSMSNTK